MKVSKKEVDSFISNFHNSDDINEVFKGEQSYWFALILYHKYIRDGSRIVYDSSRNEYGTEVHSIVYNITGDVTDEGNWEPVFGMDNRRNNNG